MGGPSLYIQPASTLLCGCCVDVDWEQFGARCSAGLGWATLFGAQHVDGAVFAGSYTSKELPRGGRTATPFGDSRASDPLHGGSLHVVCCKAREWCLQPRHGPMCRWSCGCIQPVGCGSARKNTTSFMRFVELVSHSCMSSKQAGCCTMPFCLLFLVASRCSSLRAVVHECCYQLRHCNLAALPSLLGMSPLMGFHMLKCTGCVLRGQRCEALR